MAEEEEEDVVPFFPYSSTVGNVFGRNREESVIGHSFVMVLRMRVAQAADGRSGRAWPKNSLYHTESTFFHPRSRTPSAAKFFTRVPIGE